MLRKALLAILAALVVLVGVVSLPGSAGAVTVSRAELKGGQLRLDGTNAVPGVFVMVESASSSTGIRADVSGAYHVVAANFRADDCMVVVSDRQTLTATVRLAGCTPTPAVPPGSNPPPTGSCVITPQAPATYPLGDMKAYYLPTTGCAGPVSWSYLAGRIPVGMTGPYLQGQTDGQIAGRPTTEGTYTFRVQVTDAAGATDTESFTVTVAAPRPVTVTTASADPGTAGGSYWIILTADGGLPGYQWSLLSGTLPPGLQLTSRGSIAGTPTARGTFTFTVRAGDSRGTTADKVLSITVS
ncbi:MAG: hypothetical protein QOI54_1972 [Actinomycetota bacterium]|jgi:hypothetical protein|nr:hypothetical protein [Actinomycetota bacterium]